MPDYEAIERKVEADMLRTELKPTPGDWWLHNTENLQYAAKDGKCCLMSPQLLGQPVGDQFAQIAEILGVEIPWVYSAIAGFDGHTFHSNPGYAFGAEMRRKYVTEAPDPSAAQEAADRERDRREDR